MTAQDIINRVRGEVQETDPLNCHRGDTLILGDINSCTLALCSVIKTLPKVKNTSLVSADSINIPSSIITIDFASIYDGTKHFPLTTIDFVNFARLFPYWEDTADGQPTHLVRMTDVSWMMYPNPNAAWLAKTLTIAGSTVPDDITVATETPELSITLHPCYIHYCSWIYFLILNNPERANIEYQIFDKLRTINTGTATSTTGSLLSLKMRGN